MFLPAALALLAIAQPAEKPKPFEFKDGDRIVWIGNTLVEREQRFGYWETALLAAIPDKRITLRNLGWSGDTVWGESRARFDFDRPDAGFKQLVDQTLALKPTVIFISYGTNESFEGKEGLPKFEKGLNKLLDALKPAKARIVLFRPWPLGRSKSSPDPEDRIATNLLYWDTIRKVAVARGHAAVDPTRVGRSNLTTVSLTDNGMHLTEGGYRWTTQAFLSSLSLASTDYLDTTDWTKLESLRQTVIAKNQLFFYRWRPQNETYLFGFRKHEQGRNAKEVAEFDPLVSKAEEEIEKLRKTLTK